MNLIKKINVNENGEVTEKFYCDGEEVLPESFYMLEEELEENMDFNEDDYEDCDGNCNDCEFAGYENESKHPYDVITDEINEIIEMIDNDACEDCLGKKLIDFFMVGVDMGIQGVFARKE